MPRRPIPDDGTVHEAPAARPGGNGFDPDRVQGYFTRADELHERMDEIMRKAREDCQPHVDDLKELKKEAAEAGGIPKKVFAAMLGKRRALRKAENADHALSDEQKLTFEQLELALGLLRALPLGAAALAAHPDSAADGGAAH
jgi:hypothetical protein